MVREYDLRSELSGEARTGRILSRPQGPEKLIGNAGSGNVEDDGVSRLSMVENKVSRCAASVPFVVEVVAVDEKNSLPAKQQYPRERSCKQPLWAQPREASGYQDQQCRQAEDHVTAQKNWTGERQQDR